MVRGTAMLFDEKSGIVYLKGTVPYCQIYPGAYIPRALEFSREDGESSASDIAREILGLSKLNFNNTQFDSGDPITVRAARRVGDILKHVPSGKRSIRGFVISPDAIADRSYHLRTTSCFESFVHCRGKAEVISWSTCGPIRVSEGYFRRFW
jgi:hypothetical protein